MALPSVVLLHAFPLDPRMWREVGGRLEERGYAVLAPELPGSSLDVGLAAWARRVLGLVEGRFVPVGSSMGGYLAFELWRQAPERIAALALVGSRATPDTDDQRRGRERAIRLLREAGHEPFWDDLAPKLFASGVRPEVVARARSLALEQPVAALVAALETLRDRPDSRPTLPTVDVPVLVLVGEEDRLTPPTDAEAMAAGLADVRLSRLPDAGHLAALERPEAVAESVATFLEEVVE